MTFDLCTIDWTAIGSIVTFIAMLIAFGSIYVSIKQNKKNQKFQLLLVQQEIAQKRLDELIENIIIINDSMRAIYVADYSNKLINGTFSESDRHALERLASIDELNNNKLDIQLIKYNKYQQATGVLRELSNIRKKYGEWLRDLSLLNLYKTENIVPVSNLNMIISTMVNLSKEITPNCEPNIQLILNNKVDDLDKAIDLMNIFCLAIYSYISEHKKIFEKELCAFVQKEQQKIDDMTIL